MGRVSKLRGATSYSPMDLFRFSSSGSHNYTNTAPAGGSAYFSLDNGATVLGIWNVSSSGDLGDWKKGAAPPNVVTSGVVTVVDPYNAQSTQNVQRRAGAVDTTLMSALGWKTSGVAAAVSSGAVLSGANVSSGNILN